MVNDAPLYQNMVDDFIHRIEGGMLVPDTKLPSESELGELYQVSRITVRRALAELADRGYIVKRHGIGSFVATRATKRPNLPGMLDLNRLIRKTGAEPKIKVTGFHLIVDGSEPVVHAKLGLEPDDYLYQIGYDIFADKELIGTSQWYLDYSRFPNIYISELHHQNLLRLLRFKYQFRPTFQTTRNSSLATAAERRKLAIGTGNTIVHFHITGRENDQVRTYNELNLTGSVMMYLVD